MDEIKGKDVQRDRITCTKWRCACRKEHEQAKQSKHVTDSAE